MGLEQWGWDAGWDAAWAAGGSGPAEPARVTSQHRDRWSIERRAGPADARLPSASRPELVAAVGDWIGVIPGPMPADPWSIVRLLPRRSAISRGSAGDGVTEQVLAANLDRVWIVHGLDSPINPRKLERYLAVAWESGAIPEVVLTKADLVTDPVAAAAPAHQVAVGATVRVVSVSDRGAVDALRDSLAPGQTIALLGPSGAGKSTLINLLADGEVSATGSVRESDHKGRHTTTRRELFRLPGGALLIDTPGLRELRVWEVSEGLEKAFPEIETLAADCRYRDCEHAAEPGCAVIAAVAAGRLDRERLASYRKLRAETAFQERKTDPIARAALASKHKAAMKTLKRHHPKYDPDR